MKRILLSATALIFVAGTALGQMVSLNGGPATRAMGGVDVGNAMRIGIPNTGGQLAVPNTWHVQQATPSVSLNGLDNSKINASKAHLGNLVSPTPLSAELYLNAVHPNRSYKQVVVNGLSGVRADVISTASAQSSDIYMFSENNDVIHIQSELHGRGISTGNDIVSSLRVLYQGEPVSNQKPRTIVLGYRSGTTYKEIMNSTYSFARDCFGGQDHCQDRSSVLVGIEGKELSTELGGYNSGRLVDLGAAPFDKIRVQGRYLVTAKAQTPISDIYTFFSPLNPRDGKPQMELIVGHTYLVRTISWPNEDLITKLQVLAYDQAKGFTLRYEKLVSVPAKQLQAQVAAANAYTLQNEQPIAEGEVTLFNRSRWHNYFYAAFNFEYSTTGNMFITNNGWDFNFDFNGQPKILSGNSGGEVEMIEDRGPGVDLSTLTAAQFGDLNSSSRENSSVTAVVGHTYLISHARFEDSLVLGAVTVLEIAPDSSWMRLKFRRVSIGEVPHFQKWLSQGWIPERSVTLEATGDATSMYFPYIGMRGDQGQHYYAQINLYSSETLSIDYRPFNEGQNGFIVLPGATLESVTSLQVDALAGSMAREYRPVVGDVVGVRLENYYDKTLAALRVDAVELGRATDNRPAPIIRVKFTIVTLSRAKTAYSDDK